MNAPLATVPVPTTWTTGSTEVFKTGTWRSALPRHVQAPSPCHQACPVNGEIAEWIGLARSGRHRDAWTVLTRHNPFPAIAGRICHHPCETACNRAGFDQAVSICKLERFVGDLALAQGWAFDPPPATREGHVAIVGGGPAGLSAAFQLRRRGWRVTIHESTRALGGLMRHGIPAYRLPRVVLDGEIARIVALGVELRCGVPLQTPEQFERLRDGHDAVFVATGASRVKRLPLIDTGQPWAIDGAAYLAAANAGVAPELGAAVVVVGGGSAAFDAARTARRAGRAVTILALESRAQLPAQHEEVQQALEEGVSLVDGAMLRAVQPSAAGLRLDCQAVTFLRGAAPGQFVVEPIAGCGFSLRADTLICSIGQDPDLAPFGGALTARGTVLAIDADGATGAGRVWAGGDVASTARFVTDAVGMGKRAALAIDRHLRGEAPASPRASEASVALSAIATWYHPPSARADSGRLPAAQRSTGMLEVERAFDAAQAAAESQRCFSCGTCIDCDNCVVVCPDLAIRRAGGGYEVLADYCKGCGLCVRECPTGSMRLDEERR